MEEKDGTIYIWTNLVNPKQYVGQTTRILKKRIYEHKNQASSKRTDKSLLSNAIKKYGIENFKIISFSCPEKDLDWTETFLEAALNTIAPNGYNLESGGNKNKHPSEETRKKMRDNHANFSGENHPQWGLKGEKSPHFGIKRPDRAEKNKQMCGDKHPNFGKHLTKKQKDKISETQKGRSKPKPIGFREKLSKIFIEKGINKGENNPMFGKHQTEETKQLIRDNMPDQSGENNPRARPVILISPEGIEYKLPCYGPFCKKYHLTTDRIRFVLQGKTKNYKGWTGKYLQKQ